MTGIAEELLSQTSTPEPQAEPEPVETPTEPDAVQTQAPDEPEKVVEEPEKPEPPVEPTATESKDTVPLSAHIGLRNDLSRQIDELKAKLEAKPAEPEKKVDFFEDPEAALANMESRFSDMMTNQLLNHGQTLAVREHGQEAVDEAVAWVTQAVQSSPFLAQQFAQTPLMDQPGKAVELYKAEQARAELEDPATLKQRLKDEVRLELLKEQEAKLKEKDDLKQSIPKSLTGDSSKGGLTGSSWSGPTPLNAVIGEGG